MGQDFQSDDHVGISRKPAVKTAKKPTPKPTTPAKPRLLGLPPVVKAGDGKWTMGTAENLQFSYAEDFYQAAYERLYDELTQTQLKVEVHSLGTLHPLVSGTRERRHEVLFVVTSTKPTGEAGDFSSAVFAATTTESGRVLAIHKVNAGGTPVKIEVDSPGMRCLPLEVQLLMARLLAEGYVIPAPALSSYTFFVTVNTHQTKGRPVFADPELLGVDIIDIDLNELAMGDPKEIARVAERDIDIDQDVLGVQVHISPATGLAIEVFLIDATSTHTPVTLLETFKLSDASHAAFKARTQFLVERGKR